MEIMKDWEKTYLLYTDSETSLLLGPSDRSGFFETTVISADDAKVIQKEIQVKRKKKSEIPLKFDIDDEDSVSLKINLIRYINSKNFTYQDLFDFCIRYCDDNEEEGKRLAYNTISGLKEQRNIRADTIDLLCEFLNVDIILEEKKY